MLKKYIGHEKKEILTYYFFYTVLFFITCCLVFSFFYLNGRSFIWFGDGGDGLSQHYNSFVYYGRYLRRILYNIFILHRFEIPLWDASIGYGSDIISSLNWYILGDPLTLLSAVFPSRYAEYGYALLILFRMYLCGIAFLFYCRYMKIDQNGSMVAVLVYVFCGFVLYGGIKHPYFINGMIYFPFILVGIEKIFKKQKPYVFILSVFVSGLSNFYFLYMLSVFMFLYAVFRFFMIFGKLSLKETAVWLLKFIGYYLLGLCLAAFTLFPSIMLVLSSSRVGVETSVPILYNQKYYWDLFSTLIASGGTSYWTVLSYSYIGLLSCIVLFMQKEYRALKAGIIILLVMVCVPFFGHFMNGFSYVTNRFIWGLSFFVSLATAFMVPKIIQLNIRQKTAVIVLELCFLLVSLKNPVELSEGKCIPICFMIIFTIIIFILGRTKYIQSFLVLSVIFSLFVNAYYRYSPNESIAFSKQFVSRGKAYNALTKNISSKVIADLEDGEAYYRFDQKARYAEEPYNTTFLPKTKGTSVFMSTIDSSITEFLYNDLYYSGRYTEIMLSGLDSRTFLDALLNVKYYLVSDGEKQYLPYGFDDVVRQERNEVGYYDLSGSTLPQLKDEKTWDAVLNEYFIPFGYTYDSYILKEDFERMSVEERQEALMQSALVEQAVEGLSEGDPASTSYEVSYDISNVDGGTYENGIYTLAEESGTLEISFDAVSDAELYFICEDASVEGKNTLASYKGDEEYWDSLSDEEKEEMEEKYRFSTDSGRYHISVQCEDITKSMGVFTPESELYSGYKDFLVNLGYSEEERNTVTLTFTKKGEYDLGNMRIVAQPMDRYTDYAENLGSEHMEDVEFGTNSITGTIKVSSDKLLCLSIPYGSGWSAWVDGERAEIEKINGFMMGIELKEGSHEIELRYHMQYGVPVVILTLIGAAGFTGVIWWNKNGGGFPGGKAGRSKKERKQKP